MMELLSEVFSTMIEATSFNVDKMFAAANQKVYGKIQVANPYDGWMLSEPKADASSSSQQTSSSN